MDVKSKIQNNKTYTHFIFQSDYVFSLYDVGDYYIFD